MGNEKHTNKSNDSQLLGNIILTAIMLGLMILAYTLWSQIKDNEMSHKQDLEEMAIKLEKSSERQLAYKQRLLLVSDPMTKKILLRGTENAPDSYATLMYNAELRKILLDANAMQNPIEGMILQLWGVVDGGYIDMGVIDQSQDLISVEPFVDHMTSCIITLQIEGGDDSPDLDYIYAQGKMN